MEAADPPTFHQSVNRSIHQSTEADRSPSQPSLFPSMAADQLPMDISDYLRSPGDYTAGYQSMEAADPSPFHQSLKTSMAETEADRSPSHPAMAAEPLRMDIIDFLRDPGDHTAWRSATGDEEIPRLPLLWSISGDRTELIALDCLTNIAHATGDQETLSEDRTTPIAVDGLTNIADATGDQETLSEDRTTPIAADSLAYIDHAKAKVHRIPLPVHLRGSELELFFSIGHCLLLEKRGSLGGIHIYNPFSSQFVCLPPSPTSPNCTFKIITVTVATDTKCRIALATLTSSAYPLAYTSLDCNSAPRTWINLIHRIPNHPTTHRRLSFRSPFLYADGLFYGVDNTGTRVYALDFSAPAVEFCDMTFNLPNNYSNPEYDQVLCSCCHQSASLINHGSSIHLVRWRKHLSWKDGVTHTREIDVFRLEDALDACSKQWVRVESLGGHSFFIGQNLSISMSPVDFPELKSSRVYLCFDAVVRISGDPFNCPHYEQFCQHLFYDLGDRSWGCFHEALSQFQSDGHSLFTVGMLPPKKGASTGLARTAQRTTNKQCRKRKMQRGQPRTETNNESSEEEL